MLELQAEGSRPGSALVFPRLRLLELVARLPALAEAASAELGCVWVPVDVYWHGRERAALAELEDALRPARGPRSLLVAAEGVALSYRGSEAVPPKLELLLGLARACVAAMAPPPQQPGRGPGIPGAPGTPGLPGMPWEATGPAARMPLVAALLLGRGDYNGVERRLAAARAALLKHMLEPFTAESTRVGTRPRQPPLSQPRKLSGRIASCPSRSY